MPIENDFLVFAGQSGANVVPQSSYAGQTWQQAGFSSGIAQSAQLNKPWRQSSIMSAVLAAFIVNNSGQPAIDDGTTATLLANLQTAVSAAARAQVILTDTGSANAYAAANPAPFVALPTTSGIVQKVLVAHTNSGTSTYSPDGLTAKPIYGLGGQLLQGGELPANGLATLVSFISPLLNSGNLCWVLYECIGGSQQVAPGVKSNQAVNAGQFAVTNHPDGSMTMLFPNGTIMKQGVAVTSTSGTVNVVFVVPFPAACLNAQVTVNDSSNSYSNIESTISATGFQINNYQAGGAPGIVAKSNFWTAWGK